MKSLALSVLLLLVTIPHPGSAQQSAGARVLSATTGVWLVNGKVLERGNRLKSEDKAATKSGGDLLVDCESSGVYSYSCPGGCDLQVCNGAHQKPDRSGDGQSSTFLAALSSFASALFTREPKEPVQAYARAGGVPSDAVLFQDGKGVHWGAALDRVLEGRYCLRLSPMPLGASGVPRTVSLDWDRERDSEGIVQVSDLRPGLYGLQKGTPASGNCQLDADGTTAWVLIAPAAESDRLNAEWKKYAASLEDLERADTAESTVVTLRHVVLAGLADSLGAR